MTQSLSKWRPAAALIWISLAGAGHALAQTAPTKSAPLAAPGARVVLLPVALYNAQANMQETSDSANAALSTEVLTGKLHELLGEQLLSGAGVDSVARSSEARALTGNQPCNVIVACARKVAQLVQAPWVVI